MTTKAEQETVIRWDQDDRVLHLYTAYPTEARKWERLGYAVEVYGKTQTGEPRGWRARAPLEALRLRRLVKGSVAVRRSASERAEFQTRAPQISGFRTIKSARASSQ